MKEKLQHWVIGWIVCVTLVRGFVGVGNHHPYCISPSWSNFPRDQCAPMTQLRSINSINGGNDRIIATTIVGDDDEESPRNMGATSVIVTSLTTVPVSKDTVGNDSKGFLGGIGSVVTGVVSGSVRGTVQVVETVASGVVGGTIGAVGIVGRLVGIGRVEESKGSAATPGPNPITTIDDPQSYEPKGFLGRTKRLIRRRLFNLWSRAPQRWTNAVSGDAGQVLTSAAMSKVPDEIARQRLEVKLVFVHTQLYSRLHPLSHVTFDNHLLLLTHTCYTYSQHIC